jgi:hypothetical protein
MHMHRPRKPMARGAWTTRNIRHCGPAICQVSQSPATRRPVRRPRGVRVSGRSSGWLSPAHAATPVSRKGEPPDRLWGIRRHVGIETDRLSSVSGCRCRTQPPCALEARSSRSVQRSVECRVRSQAGSAWLGEPGTDPQPQSQRLLAALGWRRAAVRPGRGDPPADAAHGVTASQISPTSAPPISTSITALACRGFQRISLGRVPHMVAARYLVEGRKCSGGSGWPPCSTIFELPKRSVQRGER